MSQRTLAISCTMLTCVVILISCAGHFHSRDYDHGWANRRMDGYKVNFDLVTGTFTREEFDAHDLNREYYCSFEVYWDRQGDRRSFMRTMDSLFIVDSVQLAPDSGLEPFTLQLVEKGSARRLGLRFHFGYTPVIPASVDSLDALLYFRRVVAEGDTISLVGHFRIGYGESHIPL